MNFEKRVLLANQSLIYEDKKSGSKIIANGNEVRVEAAVLKNEDDLQMFARAIAMAWQEHQAISSSSS